MKTRKQRYLLLCGIDVWWLRCKWWLSDHKWSISEIGWYITLAMVLTYPVVFQLNTAALGSPRADGMKHLWTLWWMRASIWDYGDFPYQTDLVNYPVGMDLYPIEPLHGMVAMFLPWVSLIALSNILVLCNMVATGVAGAWFGRLLSNSRVGGFVAGTLLEGSAVMAFFIHVGVGELHHLWWLPLGLGTLIKARKTGEWKWFSAISLCLIGSILSCFYLGFFLAISVLLWSVLTGWKGRETPKLVLQYFLAASLAIAVVVPVTKSFASSYKTGDVPNVGLWNYMTQNHGQPVTDPPSARLELYQLLTPNREAKTTEEAAYGGGRYMGWVALGLAIAGLIRTPKKALPWVAVACVGILFAFGTYWTANGVEVKTASGIRLVMPMFWLNRILGYLAEPLNFPIRFLAITAVAISAMASLASRSPKVIVFAVIAVIEIAWGHMIGYPWQRFQPRDASVLSVMKGVDDKAVIDLALAVRSDMENRFNALGTQIVHGHKLHAVPVERVEYFARDGQIFVQATQLVQDLRAFYENRGGQLQPDYRADLAVLQDAGFGWIVVGYRNGAERMPQGIVDALTQICGAPVAMGSGIAAWKLPEVSYTEAELAMFVAYHKTMMQALSLKMPGMGLPPGQNAPN